MERKVTVIYMGLVAACLILAVFAMQFSNKKYDFCGRQTVSQIEKPVMEQKSDGTKVYQFRLQKNNIDDKVLAFLTVHCNINIRIGKQTVYRVQPGGKMVKTTGYLWNFVPMRSFYAGKKVTVSLKPVYRGVDVQDPQFSLGTQTAIEQKIVKANVAHASVTVLILFVGIVLLLYTLLIAGKQKSLKALLHFSVFTILLGLWSCCETEICDLIIPWHIALVFVDHITLMLMPIPFTMFAKTLYHDPEEPIWYCYCFFDAAIVLARMLLQIFGVFDLRETLVLTHLSILLFVVMTIGMSIRELRMVKVTGRLRLNMFCIFVIVLTTFMDLLAYQKTGNGAIYGAVGFLFYITVMGSNIVKESRYLIMEAKEAEVYRELAFVDELTKVFNRTAYHQDIKRQLAKIETKSPGKKKALAVYMFDLNELKKCNDTYGHSYGDQYILLFADVLQRVFGTEGRCYRLGEDEFCVLMAVGSQNEIDNALEKFFYFIKETNRKKFVVEVSAAVGYAIYDAKLDQTLEDTRKRADQAMYQNKRDMKRKMQTETMQEKEGK